MKLYREMGFLPCRTTRMLPVIAHKEKIAIPSPCALVQKHSMKSINKQELNFEGYYAKKQQQISTHSLYAIAVNEYLQAWHREEI